MEIQFNKDEWLNWLKIKELSDRTIKEYMYYLSSFKTEQISQNYIVEYLSKHNNNVARAFIKNLLLFLRTNTNTLRDVKLVLAEMDIPRITGRKSRKIPEIITEEQAIAMANKSGNIRNRLMILTCFYCGLRLSELLNVKPYDFNWNKWFVEREEMGELKIILAKNKKQRVVFVPPQLMLEIEIYIKKYVCKAQSKNAPIFHISKTMFERIVNETSKKVLGRRIKVHTLRHSSASSLYSKGVDIAKIQQHLGHSSITTTQIYTHISEQELRDAIGKVYGIKKK